MYKTFKMNLAGRELICQVDRMCAQSNGAVLMQYGDTMVLSTATASDKPKEGIDFFPLSVEYEEKMYSVGKIPGGYNKREGKASENAILTSRVIDRPMRPLFPKDYRNDVLLDNLVLSCDQENSPELLAMLGSSLATTISDIPFEGPCASTQIGLIANNFIVNPSYAELDKSDLKLTVASTKDKVIMIEAGANEIPEDVMIKAIYKAHEINQEIISFFNEIREVCGKPKHEYQHFLVPEEFFDEVKTLVSEKEMEEAVFTDDKKVRDERIKIITEMLQEKYVDDEEKLSLIPDTIYQYEKKIVRRMILKDQKRPDNRKMNEIRPLSCEIDVVPRAHGSGMFTRGQTQILDICTLAPLSETQKIDGLNECILEKKYIHHYNFPGYSVGEAKPQRAPGRREIGHGALAERALLPMIPSIDDFPYTIRCVSETLESNGSTSQASVCASCLSLMSAGVPIKSMVAGISCGLVTGETDDDFVLLTDIQGIEDFFGDMDFKVAGTHKGITAIQMDIKIHGLTRKIVEGAFKRCLEARLYIMDEVMSKVISEPRKELSKYAPKIKNITINPEKIGDVIGKQGKVINEIIQTYDVKIDITDDGFVSVSGIDINNIDNAINYIQNIVREVEVGAIFEGKVTRILTCGAIVQLTPSKDGMVHISKLDDKRIEKVEDVVKIGDIIKVKVIDIDKTGKVSLSKKTSDF